MSISIKTSLYSLFMVFVFSSNNYILFAQSIGNWNLNDTIPLDPYVRYDTLPNGFVYYIRENPNPENRVVMNLSVKVGMLLEDDDQTQMSHLLEHLAFTPTKHFPMGAYRYLEKHGLKRGTDVNASTGFYSTNYRFTIPSNAPELIENGLQLLRDWCQGILFDAEAVEAERRAVLREMGYSKEARPDITLRYLSKVCNNRKLSKVLLKDQGKELNNFKLGPLTRYYYDWYRPDLQGVVIVGNIDATMIEKKVRSLFADLELPANPKKPEKYSVVFSGKKQFLVFTSEDKNQIEIRIHKKKPLNKLVTVGDFKTLLINELFNKMMESRFNELMNQYNPPFEYGALKFEPRPFISEMSSFSGYAIVSQAKSLKTAYQALLLEIERIHRFGFSEEELADAKSLLSDYSLGEPNSHDLANRFMENFHSGYAAPSPQFRRNLVQHLVNQITPTDINEFVNKSVADGDEDIVILAPKKERSLLPQESDIRTWAKEVKRMPVRNYSMPVTPKTLVDVADLRKPLGTISAISTDHELGITEICLENGVKVILKPFTPQGYKSNDILLHGFRPGGSLGYKKEDYIHATCAAGIIEMGGVGGLNKFEIKRFLENRRVEVQPYIGRTIEGITASCAVSELETMLQLVSLYFTAPNKNKTAFEHFIHVQRKQLLQIRRADIRDTINALVNANGHLDKKLSLEDFERLEFDRAFDIYQKTFSNAKDFTFVITGNFQPEVIETLITKYLAVLPSSSRKANMITVGASTLRGKIAKQIEIGLESGKSIVELRFAGKYERSEINHTKLKAITSVLQLMLTHRLREKEGSVYYVNVHVTHSQLPIQEYCISVNFECSPENSEHIISAVLEEIKDLKANGPKPELFENMLAIEKLSFEKAVTKNDFWLKYLVEKSIAGESLRDILERPLMIKSLTPQNIKDAAKQYLNLENYMRFVLL